MNLTPQNHAFELKPFSVFTQILPQLDQPALFHACNFDVAVREPYGPNILPTSRGHEANFTVMRTGLASLICPSDPGAQPSGWTAPCAYRANLGTERWYVSKDGPFMRDFAWLSPSATRDGLSNTALYCERLRGRASAGTFNKTIDMMIGGRNQFYTVDESIQACAADTEASRGFRPESGLCWFVGDLAYTSYNHIIGPNCPMPDCVLPRSSSTDGIIGARSYHPGGVLVGMGDGSVRFVEQSIQLSVWRGMGSRDGGELTP